MQVLELDPGKRVRWEVVDGPEEWIGTHSPSSCARTTATRSCCSRTTGWREPVEFMYHCSTKWATFLMSLKRSSRPGTVQPAPHDVQISNWH